MNHSAESPLMQLNLTKAASACGRTFRPATQPSDRRMVDLSGIGRTGRSLREFNENRTLSQEDLPIALRIAAVARHRGPDTFAESEPQCEVAMKEKELIGGLVRMLSRGQDRAARPR